MIGAIDIVRVESQEVVRILRSRSWIPRTLRRASKAVRDLESVRVDSVADCTLLMQRAARSRSPRNCRSGPAMISRWPTRGSGWACAARDHQVLTRTIGRARSTRRQLSRTAQPFLMHLTGFRSASAISGVARNSSANRSTSSPSASRSR
jgi:hypothetical protein